MHNSKESPANKPKPNLQLNIEKNEKLNLEAPRDKFHIIYILFFFLGLVHLLPWSFFSTATEYWMYKFRNTTINETDSELRTTLQAQFSATITITLQISEVAFLFVGVLFGHFIPVRTRMIGIFSIIFVLFTILAIFVKLDTDSWQTEFFALVMLIVAGINSMNAVFTITMYTSLAMFPHHYLAPYLAGSGLSKMFTSSLQILSLASGLSVKDSALLYFSLGLFVIGFTLICLFGTGRNQFYLYHAKVFKEDQKEQNRRRVTPKEGIRLFKKIWSSAAMMGLNILISNASPTALVVSEGEGNGVWNDTYFIPTITYLLAATSELTGRSIGFRFVPKRINHLGWVALAFSRIVFIPLVMFCNAQPRDHLPVLLPHDYQYILITIASGLSSGYLTTRCSYNIASMVAKEELEDAYHVNMLCTGLQMGLLCFISMVSVKLL